MRIGCLQFAPQVGDVDNNLNRADAVLSKASPDDFDILVLPELAFSGSNFQSLQHISTFLEPSGSGITALWARTVALKFDCTIIVGYPEKVDVSSSWPTGPEYYNSAIVINEDGDTIANCRKNFLYPTDETWALEGDGFHDGFLPGLGQTVIGISTDINPYRYQAPWHAFEFAFHILHTECNLVVLSMAWKTGENGRQFSRTPNEPDMDVLGYWIARLEPLIRAETEDEIIVVICNRCGSEGEAVYAGSSAVLGIHHGEVKVYGLLGRGEKRLLVVDTDHAPFAKLQHNSGPSDAAETTPRSTSPYQEQQHEQGSQQRTSTPQSSGREGRGRERNTSQSRGSAPHESRGQSENQDGSARKPTPNPAKPSPKVWTSLDELVLSGMKDKRSGSPTSISSNNYLDPAEESSSKKTRKDTPQVEFSEHSFRDRSSSKKRIYGGQVSISYVDEGRAPITPFDETGRDFWSNYKAPATASMNPRDQSLRLRGASLSKNDSNPESLKSHSAARSSPRPQRRTQGRSESFNGRDSDERRAGRPVDKPMSTEPLIHTYTPPPPVNRPSSPKSRNASRSRNNTETSSEPASHAVRAGTPNRSDPGTIPEPLQIRRRKESYSKEAIPIAASPSVFGGFDSSVTGEDVKSEKGKKPGPVSRRREMSPGYRHSVSLCDGLAMEMLPTRTAAEHSGGAVTARGSNATPKLGGASSPEVQQGRKTASPSSAQETEGGKDAGESVSRSDSA